jgi:hypothetical protein
MKLGSVSHGIRFADELGTQLRLRREALDLALRLESVGLPSATASRWTKKARQMAGTCS